MGKLLFLKLLSISYLFALVNTTLDPDYGYLYNIEGLDYKCVQGSTLSGSTQENGKFTLFNNCSKFEFSLNNKVKIGSITKEKILELATTQNNKIIFITDIQGLDSFDSSNPILFDTLQLLQTLDSDLNPYNGLTIDGSNITSSTTDFIYTKTYSDSDLHKWIKEQFASNTPTLFKEQCARANFEYFLRTNIYKKDATIDSVGPCDLKLAYELKSTAANTTYVEILGEAGSQILLNNQETGKYLIQRIGENIYPNGVYEEFELDTNIFYNTFHEFNLSLQDSKGYKTDGIYTLDIFNDTDQPYFGNIDYNITTSTQNIIDLNITDSSKENGLVLNYELNDSRFEITIDETIRFINPNPNSGVYSLRLRVTDEALHREEKVFTVTVP